MLIAILVVISINLFLTVIMGGYLANSMETVQKQNRVAQQRLNFLIKELLIRLPRRPYGVADDDTENITIGPHDSRIPR